MNDQLVISGFCTLRQHRVVHNGKLLFEDPGSNTVEFLTAAYNHFRISYPKFHKMDQLAKLGFLTTEILLKDTDINSRYKADRIGIILANSSSSLESDRNHQKTIASRDDYFPSPSVFVYTLPNVVIGEICIKNKINGEGNFFVMERFDPLFFANYLPQLFNNDIVDCCITGWTEVNGNDYESVIFLIEKKKHTDGGIANFTASEIESVYIRK